MKMIVDLDNPADIRAAMALFPKYLPAGPADGSLEERLVNNLWPRLGISMRKLVKQVEEHQGMLTIEMLASHLGRPARSIRSSLNSPLARAVKSAKQAVPGAPDLFVWRHNGTVYELGLTPEMRAALASKRVDSDFDEVPQAS